MSIQVTMTEYEVMDLARKIGMTLTREQAIEVLNETERRLNEAHRTGRPRIFDSTVYRVLQKEPEP